VVATVTLSATTTVVNAGYYVATTLTAVDGDLAADNIRTNVTIFGVVGTLSTSSGGSTYAAPVPKTGQTTVYQTGDDGSYQKGVALPTPRFTVQANPDCVTDNLTGLIWARNANLGSYMNWSNAIVYCEALTYGGETDWRLPNVEEIQSLIAWRYSFPALCNTAGTGQWTANDPFTGVQASYYCSSSTYANTIDVWYVGMHTGVVDIFSKTTEYYVWPVRGGQ